ncbi:hypothetical protein [uncultured Aquimarina sp.]|uniref:hypothetical protein n=1 Tax=uncultured Aquimarina sp. TaxID=575652 RepID=UPI0026380DA8|nr:hypothetical protein [uncultured Aquimarina sp.]
MKLAHRLGFYFFGFIIGLFLLLFFLGGKNASCDYSPNARVLKNIRIKERVFSEDILSSMQTHNIDTADITSILTTGNVDFGKSNTKLDSCNTYFIEGQIKEKNIGLHIANCDSIARMNALEILK